MLGFLDQALRRGRLDKLKLRTRFELFAFRDELRLALIKGEANPSRWFDYLDTTLTKSIDCLDDINLWESLALIAVYSKNTAIKAAIEKQHAALSDPANHRLVELQSQYTACLASFLTERHFGTSKKRRTTQAEQRKLKLNQAKKPLKKRRSFFLSELNILFVNFLFRQAEKFNALNRGLVRIFSHAPETSTLLTYAP